MPGLAIISGTGALPRLLAEHCRAINTPYQVVVFVGTDLPWTLEHPVITVQFEKMGAVFAVLKAASCDAVVFAGAMQRPHLDPALFDTDGLTLAGILQSNGASGDDATLRAIAAFFENAGFQVQGAQDIRSDIVPTSGVLTKRSPDAPDERDVSRAATIVGMLGRADVGQGAVVAQGICLGLESIQGTDKMLEFVAQTRAGFTPNPNGGQGVLFKAPKSGQDLRFDLPAIGPNTIEQAAQAGLSGIAVPHGGVMILDQGETIARADQLGLFLWVKGKT